MTRFEPWIALGMLFAVSPLIGCSQKPHADEHAQPAQVEPIEGLDLSRVTYTEHAMKRIDVHTTAVTEETSQRSDTPQAVVPHSAIIYDPHGKTWVYTSPEPRVFVRAQVTVDHISNDKVYLIKGPEPGTTVVTVGVVEIYGTEFRVGH